MNGLKEGKKRRRKKKKETFFILPSETNEFIDTSDEISVSLSQW